MEMALEPQEDSCRPKDKRKQGRTKETNTIQQESPSNSFHNSWILPLNEAMKSANSKREMDANCKIVSPESIWLNQEDRDMEDDSSHHWKEHTKNQVIWPCQLREMKRWFLEKSRKNVETQPKIKQLPSLFEVNYLLGFIPLWKAPLLHQFPPRRMSSSTVTRMQLILMAIIPLTYPINFPKTITNGKNMCNTSQKSNMGKWLEKAMLAIFNKAHQ